MDCIVQKSLNYYANVPASCTFREHASKHVREKFDMKHLTVSELHEFSCPRISPIDLARLVERSSVLIIDVRPQYELVSVLLIRNHSLAF